MTIKRKQVTVKIYKEDAEKLTKLSMLYSPQLGIDLTDTQTLHFLIKEGEEKLKNLQDSDDGKSEKNSQEENENTAGNELKKPREVGSAPVPPGGYPVHWNN